MQARFAVQETSARTRGSDVYRMMGDEKVLVHAAGDTYYEVEDHHVLELGRTPDGKLGRLLVGVGVPQVACFPPETLRSIAEAFLKLADACEAGAPLSDDERKWLNLPPEKK